ncbi:MAG: TRAP transporter small permease [Rhodobiaceae bacterium]|nr:TRAP transporter small permease [Rhodobiaceae bacterium]MCC0012806.1 TRAP transporter small permease [Rhodobiaceae bacterium]MCC0051102.1 TRAP transporter small permease [Rhodobiaceae bacterium]MCC0060167.1 TRAP transporter small permease [Rhodobiaceae bacterium]
MSKLSVDDQTEHERAARAARSDLFAEEDHAPVEIRLVDLPGLIALWSLAIIVFLQFFTRYVLNDSLAWTEEIARYVLILVAFLGAITVTRKGTHIFLEFFYRYLPATAGKWLSVAMEAMSLFFYGYMAIIAAELAQKTRTKMASAEIPKSLVYWAVAAGLAVMAFYSLVWLIRKMRQKPEDVVRDIEAHTLSDL